MDWRESHRCDPVACSIADRHYNRQSVGSLNCAPPGRCLVLVAVTGPAFWITSWPFKEYVRHEWGGAWICSAFRNEGAGLSSDLIRQALAATIWKYGPPPELGMITFVDPSKTRKKRDPGRCFIKAGFKPVGHTKIKKLIAFQILAHEMPGPEPPRGAQLRLID